MNTEILDSIDRIVNTKQRIGILISGGFDSALLSYLVYESCSKAKTENTIDFFTVPRYDDSVIHAERIIKYVTDKFSNAVPSKHTHVGNPDLHHTLQVKSGIKEVLKDHSYLNILLAGENITPAEVPGGPFRAGSKDPRLCLPFFKYTKDVIVQLAIDKNLIEIMKLSHTCTESKLLRCNMCWQCKERVWAFKKCNYADPGTM
jgi:hypothetical protein